MILDFSKSLDVQKDSKTMLRKEILTKNSCVPILQMLMPLTFLSTFLQNKDTDSHVYS